MAQLIFLAHLPLLRMQRDGDFPIWPDTWLTKLPWEQYVGLTKGAFADWQPPYEHADPVFVWFQADLDGVEVGPGAVAPMYEAKMAASTWPQLLPAIGGGALPWFHQQVVDPVCAALALAAPAGVVAPPRSSVSFLLPAGDHHLEVGGRATGGVRLQGDADQELVFLVDAAARPLPDADLDAAAGLVDLAAAALDTPEVGSALRQLLLTGEVTLEPYERTLLAVAALEGLLLPDVTSSSEMSIAPSAIEIMNRDIPLLLSRRSPSAGSASPVARASPPSHASRRRHPWR